MTSYATTHAMSQADNTTGTADKALRWIGDLDHPFYSDERHRFVWYEASAIAFQLLFLGSYFMAGAILLIGGGSAMPYVLAMFFPTLLAAGVFQTYLKRNLAEYWPTRNDMVRRRGQLGVLAGVFLVAGIVRAAFDLRSQGDFEGSFGGGMLFGIIPGLVAGVGVVVYKSRQQSKAADDADDEF